MKFLTPPPCLTYINGRSWRLDTPVSLDLEDGSDILTAPAGFTTDFASVPRIFWNIFPPQGKYSFAAIIHDYLYSVHGRVPHGQAPDGTITYRVFNRAQADTILLQAMELLGVSWLARHIIYRAVRVGGPRW